MHPGDHFANDPDIARAELQAKGIFQNCDRILVDPEAAPEARRLAQQARDAAGAAAFISQAIRKGDPRWSWAESAPLFVFRKLADAHAAFNIASLKYIHPAITHGVAMRPGRDTRPASDAHSAKAERRYAQAQEDLRRILAVAAPDWCRMATGRLNASKLARAYVNHPILRAPLGESSLARLIPAWDREGKFAKTSAKLQK